MTPTDHRATLATIRRFDQLVADLRDELDWPIGREDFEDLTFEYTPEELGIDAKNAARIEEIKRLRALSAAQPRGIFFVKSEPKRLPVVALRRILSQVVLKKRATSPTHHLTIRVLCTTAAGPDRSVRARWRTRAARSCLASAIVLPAGRPAQAAPGTPARDRHHRDAR